MADVTLLQPSRRIEDDEELVARAQADRVAFTALFDRFWDPVFTYCRYRLPSWEDAEDVASDVFLAAYAGLPRYRPRGGGFRPWLFSIAHNRVVGHQRRQRRRVTLPFTDLLQAVDPRPPVEEQVADADEWRRTFAMLDHLSGTERRVCELRLSGLTLKEIAAVLGKREGAVRKAESRAEARLRRLLAPSRGDGRGLGKEAGHGA